jgi:lipopolysaccharide transport protein LptA
VHLQTQDGFELRTEQLVYNGQEGARSDLPLEFKRRDFSGRARGMVYKAATGNLDLLADVFMRIDDDSRGKTEITSARASLKRQEGMAQFDDNVRLVRTGDVLEADRLALYGSEDAIERLRAVGRVILRSTSDNLPGMPKPKPARKGAGPAPRKGPRELRCEQFDLSLRPDRSLDDASAKGDDAILTVLPGPGEARERRILKGSVLGFRWDEKSRLTEVAGQKDTVFTIEPLPPAKGEARTVKARNFVAQFDPETGATRLAEFNKDVEFVRGPQKATADRGDYNGKAMMLSLRDGPMLVDSEQGSKLEAEVIEIFTESGDVRARYNVRHLVQKLAGGAATPFPGSDDRALVTSRLFDYDAKLHRARYVDDALLRSGKSELRANEITRFDPADGRRRLEASGKVRSLFVPEPAKPGEAEKPRTEAYGNEMAYDDLTRLVVYKGDTRIKQGDVQTTSPEATITLSAEGSEVEKLEAGDPVELTQATRKANGQRGVYTPKTGTIVVTGEKVQMKDESQQVEGRILTFFVGDDRILVDGREEARTETILKKKQP